MRHFAKNFKGWLLMILALVLPATLLQAQTFSSKCFQDQYTKDHSFAAEISFANVSDVVVNEKQQHVLVLQRSNPTVTVWNTNGVFLFAWSMQDIGTPHSITLNGFDPVFSNVWITDMYNHCIKEFTYHGQYLQSIGKCGQYTNGSGLNPPQFDLVTDIAFNSKGYFYVTDGDAGGLNNRVLVFNQSKCLVDVWNKANKPGTGPLQFNLPHSIIIDRCDRVWIVDTNNYRIQIISPNGILLSQWDCFENSLIYGIDFSYQKHTSFVVLTTKTVGGSAEILFIPFNTTKCEKLQDVGTCVIMRRLVFDQSVNISSMLHALAVSDKDNVLYFAALPGSIPPLKFHTLPEPPVSNMSKCPEIPDPPMWLSEWTATVLLTPFDATNLQTAEVQYSTNLSAMYILLNTPDGTKNYLNVGIQTFIIEKNDCLGPFKFGWVTPPREWLASNKCMCKGSLEISGIQRRAWRCPVYSTVDWYWFNQDNSPWRIFFSNDTNPSHLPLLGEFALVHFASYETGIKNLQTAYDICINGAKMKQIRWHHPFYPDFIGQHSSFVKGFSADCSEMKPLPNWPPQLHMTVTMIPVLPGLENPLPTLVVYDWKRHSQRTIMCETSLIYNAYLIVNNTYITNQFSNGSIKCLSHLKFGPPKPDWMIVDNCKCMGTITDNSALSPWHLTTIATCPLIDNRVFWTWFSNDNGFIPLLFAETLTPPGEGTGLSLADYHKAYSKDVLFDLNDFKVPSECVIAKKYVN